MNIEHRTSNQNGFRWLIDGLGIFCTFALALVVTGCVTKSKAKADAQAAYFAGQQQAMMRMSQPQTPVVTFIGPVRNPMVQWSEGLTLANAIVAAGYRARKIRRKS